MSRALPPRDLGLRRAPRVPLAALAAVTVAIVAPGAALANPVAGKVAGPPAPVAPVAGPAAPAGLAPPAPPAPPRFELRDRGDAVEIIAHDIKAARTAIQPVRSRLEVPVAGAPSARRVLPGDAMVKLIELDGDGAARVLSVKLGFDRDDVKALARFAQAIQVGDDLHLIVPRKLPAGGLAPRLPEPTLPPQLAAAVAQLDQIADRAALPQLGPRPPPAAAPPAAAAPPPATAAPVPATAAATATAVTEAPVAAPSPIAAAGRTAGKPAGDRGLAQTLAAHPDDSWSKISLIAALGLAAAGAGVWWMRRRRGPLPVSSSIEVIAQRSLGGRARILWLSAGPRELIVAVTPQQVRLLGQWRKTESTASTDTLTSSLPAAQTFAEAARDFRNEPTQSRPVSPAVSGILRLRGRTGQMPVADIAASDAEADDAWAKDILAATGSRQ